MNKQNIYYPELIRQDQKLNILQDRSGHFFIKFPETHFIAQRDNDYKAPMAITTNRSRLREIQKNRKHAYSTISLIQRG